VVLSKYMKNFTSALDEKLRNIYIFFEFNFGSMRLSSFLMDKNMQRRMNENRLAMNFLFNIYIGRRFFISTMGKMDSDFFFIYPRLQCLLKKLITLLPKKRTNSRGAQKTHRFHIDTTQLQQHRATQKPITINEKCFRAKENRKTFESLLKISTEKF
jgi:hypothetical protein